MILILFSEYLVLTTFNWPEHGCPISKMYLWQWWYPHTFLTYGTSCACLLQVAYGTDGGAFIWPEFFWMGYQIFCGMELHSHAFRRQELLYEKSKQNSGNADNLSLPVHQKHPFQVQWFHFFTWKSIDRSQWETDTSQAWENLTNLFIKKTHTLGQFLLGSFHYTIMEPCNSQACIFLKPTRDKKGERRENWLLEISITRTAADSVRWNKMELNSWNRRCPMILRDWRSKRIRNPVTFWAWNVIILNVV